MDNINQTATRGLLVVVEGAMNSQKDNLHQSRFQSSRGRMIQTSTQSESKKWTKSSIFIELLGLFGSLCLFGWKGPSESSGPSKFSCPFRSSSTSWSSGPSVSLGPSRLSGSSGSSGPSGLSGLFRSSGCSELSGLSGLLGPFKSSSPYVSQGRLGRRAYPGSRVRPGRRARSSPWACLDHRVFHGRRARSSYYNSTVYILE